MRPPKASGSRPLCSKDLVNKAWQFVTLQKKRTIISIPVISKVQYGRFRNGFCCELHSPIKQNRRFWASVSHRLTPTCEEQGGGGREVGIAVYLV